MIWAALFFIGFCIVVFGGVVRLARGPARTTFTGPLDREVDYENPYGLGGQLWATSARRSGIPQGDRRSSSDGGDRGRSETSGRPTHRRVDQHPVPGQLPLDTGFRAAYYFVERYVLEHGPDEGLILFLRYMSSDPGRRDDWIEAVREAMGSTGAGGPSIE